MAPHLSIACDDNDRTRRLFDRRILVQGVNAEFTSLPPEEMFSRAFTTAEFDVTELSFSNYMLHLAAGSTAYVGLPVFPSRVFRHSAIYVRSDRKIEQPSDLRGKALGVREYSNTASLVARGILDDEYGVDARDIRWVVGDVDCVERSNIDLPRLPGGFDVTSAPAGTLLSDLLAAGELDGLIAYAPPRCFVSGQSPVVRLFADHAAAETNYFQRTGIFPIMHLIGVRRAIAERDPWILDRLFLAFDQAKEEALREVQQQREPPAPPWIFTEIARICAATGQDYWPYGVTKNRKPIESLARYAHSQGLTPRRLSTHELFANVLLAT